jgi:hypothetical protein
LLPAFLSSQKTYKYEYPIIVKDQHTSYFIDSLPLATTDTNYLTILLRNRADQALMWVPVYIEVKSKTTQTRQDTTDIDGVLYINQPTGPCDIEISTAGHISALVKNFTATQGFRYEFYLMLGMKGDNRHGTLRSKISLTQREIDKIIEDYRLHMPNEMIGEKTVVIKWGN